MEKRHSYWVDENNNKWDSERYSEQDAINASATLYKCEDCFNCTSCNYCISCTECTNCESCSYCASCSICYWAQDCISCEYCLSCSKCKYCSNCKYLHNFETNPQVYTTPRIGSRYDTTTFYWVDGVCVVNCGCRIGVPLNDFLDMVRATHGDNEYAKQYIKEIEKVLYLIFN